MTKSLWDEKPRPELDQSHEPSHRAKETEGNEGTRRTEGTEGNEGTRRAEGTEGTRERAPSPPPSRKIPPPPENPPPPPSSSSPPPPPPNRAPFFLSGPPAPASLRQILLWAEEDKAYWRAGWELREVGAASNSGSSRNIMKAEHQAIYQ